MTTTRTILKGCPLVRTTTTQVLKHRKYGIHSASYSENSRFRCSHASAHANGPLSGIRILDLTRVLAGPFCTQILADYGAEVLKVENPKGGDDTRLWRTAAEKDIWKLTGKDMSAYFCAINRNKMSITLNLKQDKGRKILFRLVKDSDVVVENFVPGKMDKMGIGYEKLREINPLIIHASVSGYGASGPYSHRAGYDAIAAAEAGMLHITGERDGPPTRPGLGLTDMSTGLYLHGAILAALYARRDTGRGQKIDASLFESQVSLLSNVAMSWLNAGEHAKRWGTEHPSIVPYQAFKTKDGHLVLGATNNRQFQTLCHLMKLSGLPTDPRFIDNSSRVQNRAELKGILEPIMSAKATEVWLANLEGSGLPYGPVNTIEEVFSHPQTAARDMVYSLPHKASVSGRLEYSVCSSSGPDSTYTDTGKRSGTPVKFSETKPQLRRSPPSLGEHTTSTLERMGFSPKEIRAMREQGIV